MGDVIYFIFVVLFYIYTSGTTGYPKAAIIRHSRFIVAGLGTYNLLNLRRNEDCVYLCLPLYHFNAGVMGISNAILWGFPVAIRHKFSASKFWEDCIKYNCTVSLKKYILTQNNIIFILFL